MKGKWESKYVSNFYVVLSTPGEKHQIMDLLVQVKIGNMQWFRISLLICSRSRSYCKRILGDKAEQT